MRVNTRQAAAAYRAKQPSTSPCRPPKDCSMATTDPASREDVAHARAVPSIAPHPVAATALAA